MQLEISDKTINHIIYTQLKISNDFKLDVWEEIKKSILELSVIVTYLAWN